MTAHAMIISSLIFVGVNLTVVFSRPSDKNQPQTGKNQQERPDFTEIEPVPEFSNKQDSTDPYQDQSRQVLVPCAE